MSAITIVGGGLAGLLLAQALLDAGVDALTLIHHQDPLQASDAPLAICHPFPGRSLAPHPLLRDAYNETRRSIANWRRFAPDLVQELSMLRPLKGANFDRLLRSYDKHWRGQHDPWLTILLNEESRHLKYGPCFAIALGALRARWLKNLEDSGLTVVHGHCDAIDAQAQTLTVNEASYAFDHLVLCNGRELSKWLPPAPLIYEGGELGTFAVTQPLTTLVSQAGLHVGPRSEQEVVVGATRWETEPASPASSVLPELQERMREVLPVRLQPVSAWRGVRAIYPVDRLPIAGEVPGHDHLSVLGAFGSKGLLWGPYAARQLAQRLAEGTPIPPAIHIDRLWSSPS